MPISRMPQTALDRLKDYRAKHFEFDYEMADLLDMTRAHFSQLIRGIRRPGLATAAKIEACTGIPASSWTDSRRSKSKPARKSDAETLRVA
jgi:transcriptional regulator with XRE-family HTH domain